MILRYEMSTAAKEGNGGAVGTRHATRSAQEARALVVERPARKTPRCLLLARPGIADPGQTGPVVGAKLPRSRCTRNDAIDPSRTFEGVKWQRDFRGRQAIRG